MSSVGFVKLREKIRIFKITFFHEKTRFLFGLYYCNGCLGFGTG